MPIVGLQFADAHGNCNLRDDLSRLVFDEPFDDDGSMIGEFGAGDASGTRDAFVRA